MLILQLVLVLQVRSLQEQINNLSSAEVADNSDNKNQEPTDDTDDQNDSDESTSSSSSSKEITIVNNYEEKSTEDLLSQSYILVDAQPENGFNFPYLLIKPTGNYKNDKKFVIVEAYNTGQNNNSLEYHINEAINYGTGSWSLEQRVSNRMNTYRIMPIIPRFSFYDNTNNDRSHPHGLNRLTLTVSSNIGNLVSSNQNPLLDRKDILMFDDLENQILRMVCDGQNYLRSAGLEIEEKVFVAGFSAAGSFSSRFTVFHPEKVQATYFGGEHIPFIPAEQYNGDNMIYPLGSYDFKEITGYSFNKEEYNAVPKMMYLGGLDSNDPVPNNDVFGQAEKAIIFKQYGYDYLTRWNNVQRAFFEVGGEGIFLTSKKHQHDYDDELVDIVYEFFMKNVNDRGYLDSYGSLVTFTGSEQQFTLEDKKAEEKDKSMDLTLIVGGREPVEFFVDNFRLFTNNRDLTSADGADETEIDYAPYQIFLLDDNFYANSYMLKVYPEISDVANGSFVSFTRDGKRIVVAKDTTTSKVLEVVKKFPKDILTQDY